MKTILFSCAVLFLLCIALFMLLGERQMHYGYHADGSLRYVVTHGYAEFEREGYCLNKAGVTRELDDDELARIIVGGVDTIHLPGCDD